MIFLKNIIKHTQERALIRKYAYEDGFELKKYKIIIKDALGHSRHYACLSLARKDLQPLLNALLKRLKAHKNNTELKLLNKGIKDIQNYLKEQGQ